MSPTAIVYEREYQDLEGLYQLPKDAIEHDRLDGQSSALIALMHGRPFHAPLRQPRRILDIGCGTASMTNLLGAVFLNAEVIGVDIAPVPPARHKKLQNVTFVQGDIRELVGNDPRFELGSFDYVFERLLVFGMTEWPKHIDMIARLVKPGGWLEVQEADMILYSSKQDRISEDWWWYQHFIADSKALGLNVNIGGDIADILRNISSLMNVQENVYHFKPYARPEHPEYAGLEQQILPLFRTVMRKICEPRRSPEIMEQMEKDLLSKWSDGFAKDDHHNFHSVIGQRV